MHSWVFRNRARLREIYGCPPPAPLPRRGRARSSAAPGDPPEGAGKVVRRSRYVVLAPMPRRAR